MTMTEEIAKASPPTSESTIRAWALALFDRAAEAHRLPADARRLLETAAGFYAAASHDDADHAARRGRDLALATPIDGLTSDEQAIVAGVEIVVEVQVLCHEALRSRGVLPGRVRCGGVIFIGCAGWGARDSDHDIAEGA